MKDEDPHLYEKFRDAILKRSFIPSMNAVEEPNESIEKSQHKMPEADNRSLQSKLMPRRSLFAPGSSNQNELIYKKIDFLLSRKASIGGRSSKFDDEFIQLKEYLNKVQEDIAQFKNMMTEISEKFHM